MFKYPLEIEFVQWTEHGRKPVGKKKMFKVKVTEYDPVVGDEYDTWKYITETKYQSYAINHLAVRLKREDEQVHWIKFF